MATTVGEDGSTMTHNMPEPFLTDVTDQHTYLNRRDALKLTAGALAAVALGDQVSVIASNEGMQTNPASTRRAGSDRDWSAIRGFNYQPSYGSTGLELWQKFDANVIETELARGKRLFPKMNALRWWHSWDAFNRDPDRYARNFDKTLELAAKVGCRVMPCLFNRWHSAQLDYGGIYVDHFLPNASWVQERNMFNAYLETVVGRHKDDPRILAWDICNEPYSYSTAARKQMPPQIVEAETAWLKAMYDLCKSLGPQAPLTVGIHPGVPLDMVEPISDVLSIHPYWMHNQPRAQKDPNGQKALYEKELDRDVAIARKAGKPLVATECCWGSLDDQARVESIRYTLTQLKARGIGWTVYLLHHSMIADAHRPEFGPLGQPGNLAFIEADGSLRPGHDVFNEF